MSKAFTSEETEDAPVTGRTPQRAPRGQERPITPAGHRALVEHLQHLETTARLQARALGTEHEREQALRHVDVERALVAATLESVRVVHPPTVDDGVVRFGSVVTLRWRSGRRQTVQLVGPDEADVKAGRLAVDAPLARALLDATVGAVLEVERPSGAEEVEVEAVRPG